MYMYCWMSEQASHWQEVLAGNLCILFIVFCHMMSECTHMQWYCEYVSQQLLSYLQTAEWTALSNRWTGLLDWTVVTGLTQNGVKYLYVLAYLSACESVSCVCQRGVHTCEGVWPCAWECDDAYLVCELAIQVHASACKRGLEDNQRVSKAAWVVCMRCY